MNSPVLTGVQTQDVPAIWPFVEGMLTDGVRTRNPEYDGAETYSLLVSGYAQLWLATSPGRQIEAVLITEITDEGDCNIRSLVGEDFPRWLGLLGDIEDWAKANGCKRMTTRARMGWKRALKGYKTTSVFMEKDL